MTRKALAINIVLFWLFHLGSVVAAQSLSEIENLAAKCQKRDGKACRDCTAAVNRLTDQALLAQIARMVGPWEVRQAALYRLTDQALLTQVARTDENPRARSIAVRKLTDQALLANLAKTDKEPRVRAAAVGKLADNALLAEIAKAEQDSSVRSIAVAKLTDQALLADLAKTDRDSDVRSIAVRKLTDQTLLADLAKTAEDLNVRLTALGKLPQGRAASSATGVDAAYLGRFTHLKSDEAIVFLAVRMGRPLRAIGIGDGGPMKGGKVIASSIIVNAGGAENCTICHLGETQGASIIAVVTNRVSLRIGAGIWFEGSLGSPGGVVVSEGVVLPQLELGKAYLLGQLQVVENGTGKFVIWAKDSNLDGWLRQLFEVSAPAIGVYPPPILASARDLQPPEPTDLEPLYGRVASFLSSTGAELVLQW
jgi:hypothetical protein